MGSERCEMRSSFHSALNLGKQHFRQVGTANRWMAFSFGLGLGLSIAARHR